MVTIETLKAQLGGIQTEMDFNTVQPFVKTATRWFRRLVSPALVDHIEDLADTSNLSESDAELVDLAQSCLCWYAYDLAFPHLKIRVGDLGLFKSSPQNSTAVTKWEYVDSKEANVAMLDLSLEEFFQLLEQTRPDAWTESDAYKERQRVLIRSAAELSRYVPAVARRSRFFDQLVTYIERAERLYLRPVLTEVDFTALKTRFKTDALTATDEELIARLLPALANYALYEAMPHLPLQLAQTGLSEKRDKTGLYEEVAPGDGLRDNLRRQFWKDAGSELAEARAYLNSVSSATQYAGYYQSRLARTTGPDYSGTNSTLVIL